MLQWSFTLFITLCVPGCDFLIYVLYEWAFGERRRTLMRKAASRRRVDELQSLQPRSLSTRQNSPAAKPVIPMDAKRRRRPASSGSLNRYNEELAYRRVAASFAQLKPHTVANPTKPDWLMVLVSLVEAAVCLTLLDYLTARHRSTSGLTQPEESEIMKVAESVFHARVKENRQLASMRVIYQSIASGLVSKMVTSLESTETRKFSPPF